MSDATIEFPRAMGEQDAMLWRMERDRRFRSTLLSVTVLDAPPDRARFTAKIARMAAEIPRLRQRIVPMPELVSTPIWAWAEDFDLAYHLRFLRLGGAGTMRELLDFTAAIGRQAFDPERPPWEFYAIDGLREGPGGENGAAILWKMHHAVTDGVAGVRIMRHSFDLAPDGDLRAAPPPRALEPGEDADVARLSSEAVRERLAQVPGRLWEGARKAVDVARDPVGAAQSAARDLASLRRLLADMPGPLSPVMTARSTNFHVDAFQVPIAALKAAAHAAGGTVSDAFLAGVTGGLHRYHARHGKPVAALNASIPISLRNAVADSDVAGTHIAVARLALRIDEPDPARRIRAHHAVVAEARDEPAQAYSDVVAGVLYRLPLPLALRTYAASATKNDLVASSVPGIPAPVFVAGARARAFLTFGPLSGAAVNATLFTIDDMANVSLNADAAAVPDLDALVACVREGFDEVLALA